MSFVNQHSDLSLLTKLCLYLNKATFHINDVVMVLEDTDKQCHPALEDARSMKHFGIKDKLTILLFSLEDLLGILP